MKRKGAADAHAGRQVNADSLDAKTPFNRGQMSPVERSLEDKRLFGEVAARNLESARKSGDPLRMRWADRITRTGHWHSMDPDSDRVIPGGSKLPDATWVRILELHRDGYSMRKIAAEVGCSVGTAHRIAKNYVLSEQA